MAAAMAAGRHACRPYSAACPTSCLHTLSPHFIPTLCRKRKRKRLAVSRITLFHLVLEPRYCRNCRYCRRIDGRLLARVPVDEQTLVPPARTPGTAAYAPVRSPRVAHYVRKRFLSARTRPRFLSRRLRRHRHAAGTPRLPCCHFSLPSSPHPPPPFTLLDHTTESYDQHVSEIEHRA